VVKGIEQYVWVLTWNPMYYLLEGYRKVLVNPGLPAYKALDAKEGFPTAEWPWHECAIVLGAGIAAFALGYSIFLVSKRKFADEL
jgi:ABC-type polysaccharide/polyol phosphate export permease